MLKPSTLRAVWAAVSATPGASIRQIAGETGYCMATVHAAINELEAAGYIARHHGPHLAGTRATRVLIPFLVVKPSALAAE